MSVSSTTMTVMVDDCDNPTELTGEVSAELTIENQEGGFTTTLPECSTLLPSNSEGSRGEVTVEQPSHPLPLPSDTSSEGEREPAREIPSLRESPPTLPVPAPSMEPSETSIASNTGMQVNQIPFTSSVSLSGSRFCGRLFPARLQVWKPCQCAEKF